MFRADRKLDHLNKSTFGQFHYYPNTLVQVRRSQGQITSVEVRLSHAEQMFPPRGTRSVSSQKQTVLLLF